MSKLQKRAESRLEKKGVEARKKRGTTLKRYIPIGKVLLATIGAAGILSIALVAPNSMRMFELFGFGKRRKRKYTKFEIDSALERLKANGFVWLQEKDGETILRLTKKGEAELAQFNLGREYFRRRKPLRWDRRWRIVIFDIEENNKDARNSLRDSLITFGFKKLQNSVWVHPYDCEELVMLLKANFELGKEVLYMVVESIENDATLREMFELA